MEEGQCQTYSLLEVMQLNLYYIGLMCKSKSAPDLRTCVLLVWVEISLDSAESARELCSPFVGKV